MKTIFVVCVVALFVVATLAADVKPRPPFLEGADDKQVQEFEELLKKSGSLTDKQIDEAVDEWVTKQAAGIKVRDIWIHYYH